jgi:poly[(R)-3-hydroxyalkanoate] polymerase subunit PhaC
MTERPAPGTPVFEGWWRLFDPFGIARSVLQVQQAWLRHPSALTGQLGKLGAEIWALQFYLLQRFCGIQSGDLFPAVKWDERFQEPIWTENPYFDAVKQSYLLYTRWLEDLAYAAPELPDRTRRKAAFWLRQWLDTPAPTNYFWTNPHAVQRFVETAGFSVLQGVRNWLADCRAGEVRMVDGSAFRVGENLATTPGRVVYRNALVELLQYAPSTAKVHSVPILIVAPWINKYYILDLNDHKSLIRWLVRQGFTVFVTSWKNPGTEMRGTTFEDYLFEGLLPSVEAVRDICRVPSIHATGYCIGGTLLAALMGWLAADERAPDESPIAHWTLLATLVDFEKPGDIEAFVDPESVVLVESLMACRGYLDGANMARAFRLLRPNSLIWHYHVHSYLYGEDLPAFDVLYWNTDSTRLPEAMHSFYLREFYLANKLSRGMLRLGGRPISLAKVPQPLYAVGTEQDHITPWRETYKVAGLVSGPVRYALATSGHIMGVISPPVDPPKRRYRAAAVAPSDRPDAWRENSPLVTGSWWEDWGAWLAERCGSLHAPPALGNARFPTLADAPGTYVMER